MKTFIVNQECEQLADVDFMQWYTDQVPMLKPNKRKILGVERHFFRNQTIFRPKQLTKLNFWALFVDNRMMLGFFLGGMNASVCKKLKATGGRTERGARKKRDLENRARKVKDQAKRNIKSAIKTLHTLEYNNAVGLGKIEKGEGIVRMIGELNLNNLIKLNQKIHLNGLMLLYSGRELDWKTVCEGPSMF